MKFSEDKIVLGLETGIEGGSAALIKGGEVICRVSGASLLSRSEDLLLLVKRLLEQSGLSKDDIGCIAVSDAPGSATGIRIGLATAAGLKDSMRAEIIKISPLKAQAVLSRAQNGLISALYTEKKGVYYIQFRFFDGEYLAETEIINEPDLFNFGKMLSSENKLLVMDHKLALKLTEIPDIQIVLQQLEIQTNKLTFGETIGLAANTLMRPITN